MKLFADYIRKVCYCYWTEHQYHGTTKQSTLIHFSTVTTNINGGGGIYPYIYLWIVVCPFVPLLSFFGPLYYLSFFDLPIAITLQKKYTKNHFHIEKSIYMIKDVHVYVMNCFLSTHILLKSPVFSLTWCVRLNSVNATRKHIAHDNVPRYNHRLIAFI
jgi:hypothetical protein